MSRGDWDEQAVDKAVAELLEAWRISGLSGDELHLGLDHEWENGPEGTRLVEFVARTPTDSPPAKVSIFSIRTPRSPALKKLTFT